jgi:hypothetical protein
LSGVAAGIFGFFTGAWLAGWAGAHSYILNGKRMDQAPSGENLWLRNRLAEHDFLLSVLLTSVAVFVVYKVSKRSSVAHGN